MKRTLFLAILLLIFSGLVSAQQVPQTPNLKLYLPQAGNQNAWLYYNYNANILDTVGLVTPQEFDPLCGTSSSHDCTNAMNAAAATGKQVYYPAGFYGFSTINACQIRGDGPGLTVLESTDITGADLITCNEECNDGGQLYGGAACTPFYYKDFTIMTPQGAKTQGAAIAIKPTGYATYENNWGIVDNVLFFNTPIGFHSVSANVWKLHHNNFRTHSIAAILVENQAFGDGGDSSIIDNTIMVDSTTGDGILYKSGGGLRVIGNKIWDGKYCFEMAWNGNTSSGALFFEGNGCENQTTAGFYFGRDAGNTYGFGRIIISGNEIAPPVGDAIATDTSGFLSEIIIGGNYIYTTGTGINLHGVTKPTIGTNYIACNGGSTTGISIDAACTDGLVDLQNYSGCNTDIANSSITTQIQTAYNPVVPGMYNMVAARTLGTMYLNATGRTMRVNVVGATNNAAFDLMGIVSPSPITVATPWTAGGTVVDHQWLPASVNGGESITVTMTVPNGYFYGVDYIVAGPSILNHWIEWY